MDRRAFLEALSLAGVKEGANHLGLNGRPDASQVTVVDAVTELISMQPASLSEQGVAIALGYAKPEDKGGGVFVWNRESVAPVNQATLVGKAETEGRWRRMHSGVLPVEALGGIGVTTEGPHVGVSDALSLASTLTALHTVVCSETYSVQDPIVIDGPLTIRGGTFETSASCFQSQDHSFVFGIRSSHVTLDGLTIVGPTNNVRSPVVVVQVEDGSANFSLKDTSIRQFGSVRPNRECSDPGAAYISIARVVAVQIGHTGCQKFKITGCDVEDLYASSNEVIGDSDGVCTGILVGTTQGVFNSENPTTGLISDCHFRNLRPNEDADGIKTQLERGESGLQTRIENCTFIDCAKRGIKCQAPNTDVIGNTFRTQAQVARTAVSVYRPDCKVLYNRVKGRFNIGIEVQADRCEVASNDIHCTASAGEITYRNSSGVWIRSAERVVLRDSDITGFMQSVVVDPGEQGSAHDIDIRDNRLAFSIGNAIEGRSPAGTIVLSGNKVVNPGRRAVLIYIPRQERDVHRIRIYGGSIKYDDCTGEMRTEEAISIQGADRLLVQNVLFDVNCIAGILLVQRTKRILVTACIVEDDSQHSDRSFVHVIESDHTVIKDNLLPSTMIPVRDESSISEEVEQFHNHVW